MKCWRCDDCGWVCERHRDKPWAGDDPCGCGAAGMPCPACNKEDPPRMPEGFETDADDKGGGALS
jgi:hypothetical protein